MCDAGAHVGTWTCAQHALGLISGHLTTTGRFDIVGEAANWREAVDSVPRAQARARDEGHRDAELDGIEATRETSQAARRGP